MKNIHLLPTESFNPIGQQIWRRKNGGLFKPTKSNPIANNLEGKVNIYITSDEEIKKGDWCFEMHNGESKATSPNFTDEKGNRWWLRQINMNCSANDPECKKIILTTDQDLIEDGVQAIGDEFLEWFVKNPSCEKIKILRCPIEGLYTIDLRKLIPKEEPKSNIERLPFPELVKEFAEYYKDIPLVEEPKQETTLEEAANKYSSNKLSKLGFIEGAKWQQKRMYSEKDMLEFANLYSDININDSHLKYFNSLPKFKNK